MLYKRTMIRVVPMLLAIGLIMPTGFAASEEAAPQQKPAIAKLCTNCAQSPITGLTRRRREVLGREDVSEVSLAMARECASVGRAAGAKLPPGFAEEVIARQKKMPPDATTSMLTDAWEGKPLEMDAFTGAVIRAYSWILMLGNEGFLNSVLVRLGIIPSPYQLLFTQKGVIIGLVHFSMPVMILILAAALSHVDPNYERSAQSLGAGPVRTFWTVTLPLSMPGIVSGGLVIFAWTFSAFPTPALVGGGRVKMIANVVEDLALEAFNWPGGAAFAMVSLAATFVLIYVLQRFAPRVADGHREVV